MGNYDGSIKIDSNINSKGFNEGINTMTNAVRKLGKVVIAAFSIKAITSFVKASVDAASELSNSFTGLKSILDGQGKSFSQAKNFIEEYISDGLVSATEATTAYKNLAARGYNTDQIQKVMTALKDSATFGRQASYTLGEAVQSASEGLKNENSILVDNAGVTKNVAKMWEDYAKSVGKSTSALTQQEKIQAEVNGILEETKFQTGDSEIYLNTYSGQLARLNASFTTLKQTVGNIFIPIFQAILPYINAVIQGLTKVAKVFASVVQLIFGKTATTSKELASNTSDAATGVSNLGNAAEKAGKQAKGALASFDDLNVLAQDTSSSSSGTSGVSGGLEDLTIEDTEIGSDITISPLISLAIEKLKELADICRQGFDISFGNTNFDGILNHFTSIKNNIIDIWTDPEVLNSANNWINTISYTLGQAVGSISRIGINIAESLIGSIDVYLSDNLSRIKDFITSMFDISGEGISLGGDLFQAIGGISDAFKGDSVKQIGSNIIEMFSNPLMDALEICSKFVTDIKGILFQPIIDNVDKIQSVIENTLPSIESITGTLADTMGYVGEKLNEVYDAYISPFMDSLKTGFSDTFSKVLEVYNQYIAPFISTFAESLQVLWIEHLQPLVDKIGAFLGSVISAIQVLWENCLKPLIDWIVETIIPVLVPIFESIWNTIKNVFGSISDAIGGIIDVFKGLIDFVVGVFTGDWSKAWEGIKDFFSGIWDAIKGIVSAVWNAIKGIVETAINIVSGIISTVLNAIKSLWNTIWNWLKNLVVSIWNNITTTISNVFNGIKNTISNILNAIKNVWNNIWNGIKTTVVNIWNGIWGAIKSVINSILGGIESFVNGIIKGINKVLSGISSVANAVGSLIGLDPINLQLSTISLPRLATGAVIPPNQEFLAVLGDQKKGVNIETPLETMIAAFNASLDKRSSAEGSQVVLLQPIGESEFARFVIKSINGEQEAAGKTLLKI